MPRRMCRKLLGGEASGSRNLPIKICNKLKDNSLSLSIIYLVENCHLIPIWLLSKEKMPWGNGVGTIAEVSRLAPPY
jgi:hypothetical protein